PEDVMEQIADELLEDGSLKGALRRMLQRGAEFSSGRRMMGLQELLDRLRNARSNNLDRYNLGSIMDDIVERLEKVIDTERHGIRQRLGEEDRDEPGDGSEAGSRAENEDDASPSGDQPGDQGEGQQGGQGQRGAGSPTPGGGRRQAPGSTDPMFRDIFEG